MLCLTCTDLPSDVASPRLYSCQVADALDDPHVGQWVNLAAQYLIRQLVPTPYSLGNLPINPGTETGRQAAKTLSFLPDHVQHLVFAAVAAHRAYSPSEHPFLNRLLEFMPRSLGPKIVAAAISPSKVLKVRLAHVAPTLALRLSHLPAAPPPILTLEAHGVDIFSRSDKQTVHSLAKALRHHSGLTSLSLSSPSSSTAPLHNLTPALITLTSLHSLRLGTPGAPFPSDSVLSLQQSLSGMPRLQELSMFLLAGSPESRKRARDAHAASPAPTRHSLAATLSAATALTSLHVHLQIKRYCTDWRAQYGQRCTDWAVGATSALALPRLSDLNLQFVACEWVTALLSHLVAPLTALTLGCIDPDHTLMADYAHAANPLITAVSKFSLLRRLTDLDCGSLPHAGPNQAFTAALTSEGPGAEVLQRLTALHFSITSGMLQYLAQRLASDAPQLQCASIGLLNTDTSATEWAEMVPHLERLQHLSLSLHHPGPNPTDLQKLACMTALKITDAELRYAAQCAPALVQATQLRRLHLATYGFGDLNVEGRLMSRLLACLAQHPGLTSLVIEGGRTTWSNAQFKLCAAEGAAVWPALRRLGLDLDLPHSNGGKVVQAVVLAACTLPRLQELVLAPIRCLGAEMERGPAWDLGAGSPEEDAAMEAARAAGVALEFEAPGGLYELWTC